MALMPSRVSSSTEDFRLNREAYLVRVAELRRRRCEASAGGPERARRLHKQRKQMLLRERVTAPIDPGSPLLEFPHLAGEGLYEGAPPGGSMITGVGLVSAADDVIESTHCKGQTVERNAVWVRIGKSA